MLTLHTLPQCPRLFTLDRNPACWFICTQFEKQQCTGCPIKPSFVVLAHVEPAKPMKQCQEEQVIPKCYQTHCILNWWGWGWIEPGVYWSDQNPSWWLSLTSPLRPLGVKSNNGIQHQHALIQESSSSLPWALSWALLTIIFTKVLSTK